MHQRPGGCLGSSAQGSFFPTPGRGWRVQGERCHLFEAPDRARDLVARTLLESRGIQVIDLFEDDLLTRSDYVLNLAWEGREVQGRKRACSPSSRMPTPT